MLGAVETVATAASVSSAEAPMMPRLNSRGGAIAAGRHQDQSMQNSMHEDPKRRRGRVSALARDGFNSYWRARRMNAG